MARSRSQSAKRTGYMTIRHPDFARRLAEICDEKPEIPPLNQGRLVWFRQQFASRFRVKITLESVRRWFAGDSRPRMLTMKQLAEVLEVPYEWLSLGVNRGATVKEQKARNALADGAVNVVAGFIQMDGGHPAFPPEGDETDEDLTAIIGGRRYVIHVALGAVSETSIKFLTPARHEHLTVVGVVPVAATRCDFLYLAPALLDAHGKHVGGGIELAVKKIGMEYRVGAARCPRISNFAEITR